MVAELKEIGVMLSGMGDDAKEGLIYYLYYSAGSTLLGYLFGVLLVVATYKIVMRVILASSSAHEAERHIRGIRSDLGIGTTGYLTGSELRRIRATIINLRDGSKSE